MPQAVADWLTDCERWMRSLVPLLGSTPLWARIEQKGERADGALLAYARDNVRVPAGRPPLTIGLRCVAFASALLSPLMMATYDTYLAFALEVMMVVETLVEGSMSMASKFAAHADSAAALCAERVCAHSCIELGGAELGGVELSAGGGALTLQELA